MKLFLICILLLASGVTAHDARASSRWRLATQAELKVLIPARAPVEKERIETEFRTASGIVNAQGKFLAGVVLITAGYAAEGKYSNFFITQIAMKVGAVSLRAGTYVFGWKRKGDDALDVSFYDSESGKFVGLIQADRTSRIGRLESFHISLPAEGSLIQIGRFAIKYQLAR